MDEKTQGYIYISSSMNNVIISLTNSKGDVIKQLSPGKIGLKKSKRQSSFAGQVTMSTLLENVPNLGIREWKVRIKGFGQGRDGALKSLIQSSRRKNLKILEVRDITGLPHNGCRAKSPRRI